MCRTSWLVPSIALVSRTKRKL